MKEKESYSPSGFFFSLNCPEGREQEIRELFRSLRNVSVDPDAYYVNKMIITKDGVQASIEGREIKGFCLANNPDRIEQVLREKGLAESNGIRRVIFSYPDQIFKGK